MNQKKKISILVTVLAVILVLGGCKGKAAKKEAVTLSIGMMSSSDVVPYVIMNKNAIAEKYGIVLELETFTSAKDRDAAFQAGELDGVLTDYIGICMYQNAGFDVKITGITDGDYLLVAGKDSGITSIDEIRGKSIAISENTLIDYSLDKVVAGKGLSSVDVVREIVPRIPDRLELLRNNKIDLGLLPEPFATLALNDGAVYLGSANEIGLYPAVSAFSQKAITEKEEAIKNLYLAYNEAVDYINNTDISEYEAEVIKAVGYPEEMAGKIELPEYRKSTLPPKEDVLDAISWAADRELCKDDLTYEQLTCLVD